MTLRCRETAEMPADIAAVGQQLLPVTNLYRIIGDQLADLVRDADFADLYDTRGRPALSPALLALVTVFPFLEGVPDREAAEAVVLRLDWTYALHLPLTYAGFDYSCLCSFRARLVAHHREAPMFDTILTKVRALGLLKKRGTQRTDSIAVRGAARRIEARTEAFAERMRARPAIEGTLSELVRAHGLRRHRYRGAAKRQCENLFKAAACNLKRVARVRAARGPSAPAATRVPAPALWPRGDSPAPCPARWRLVAAASAPDTFIAIFTHYPRPVRENQRNRDARAPRDASATFHRPCVQAMRVR